MAPKKSMVTKSKVASKKSTKKTAKVEKSESTVALAIPSVEHVAETAEQISTNMATVVSTKQTSANNTQKAKKTQPQNKGLSGIPALLELARILSAVLGALKSINVRFDERETSAVSNIKRFGIKHAKIRAAGGHLDHQQVERTIGLTRRAVEALEVRFDAIMNDSFVIFEKEIRIISQTIPDIRARDFNQILKLQDTLHTAIRDSEDYDEIIDAYNAMMNYLPSVSEECKSIVEADRERKRTEKRVAISNELIAELEGLDL